MGLARIISLGLLGVALGACNGGTGERPERPTAPASAGSAGAGSVAAAPVSDEAASAASSESGPPLSEAAARALLAERFRAAGFRVRNDVVVSGEGFELTADGYDPERRVGFEYVAAEEADTDLLEAERAALSRDTAQRLLVLDAGDASAVRAAAEAFLGRIADTAAGAGTGNPEP